MHHLGSYVFTLESGLKLIVHCFNHRLVGIIYCFFCFQLIVVVYLMHQILLVFRLVWNDRVLVFISVSFSVWIFCCFFKCNFEEAVILSTLASFVSNAKTGQSARIAVQLVVYSLDSVWVNSVMTASSLVFCFNHTHAQSSVLCCTIRSIQRGLSCINLFLPSKRVSFSC